MNKLSVLLKNNLKTSLSQPLTYFMAIIFEVFIAFNFYIRKQFFGGNGTTDLLLFFTAIPYISIIVIPAICYKFSSSIYDTFVPLKNIHIILSHYFASLIIFVIFVILLLPSILFINLFGSIDGGQVFTGLLFIILYGAALIALCCFINELCSSPVFSFIISAIVLAVFNSAHLLVVYISFSNIIASLLKELSFAWHFDAASKGIIDTRDLFFFIISSILFLSLALLTVNIKKGRVFSKSYKLSFVICGFIYVLLLLNTSAYYKRFDFSSNKTFSVSKYTKQLTSKVQQNLKITYYISSSLSKLYPQIRDVQDYLISYSQLNKNISFIVKNPDKDSSITQTLESYGITSQQMQAIKNNGTEYLNVYSAIVLEYLGNLAVIPFTMYAQNLEYELDIKVNQLLSGRQRIVNIVVGNGMSLYQDYSYLVPWLNSQGFVCNQINIEDSDFSEKLNLATGPLMVIGDSQINIENAIAIENYILSEKGNALLCINPYSVDIENDWSLKANSHTNIVEMAENWGLWFEDKIAADVSCSQITMYSQEDSNDSLVQGSTYTKVLNYPLWVNLLPQQYTKSGVTLFWATPLTITESEESFITPMLVTSPASYYYTCHKDNSVSLIQTNPFELQNLSTSDKTKLTQIVGAEISGKLTGLYNYGSTSKAKVFVIPDQYFVNSLMTGYIGGKYGDYRNFDFITQQLLYLNNEPELADLHSRAKKDISLYKIAQLETPQQLIIREFIVLVVLLFGIPLFIIAGGVIVWIRKKSRLMHI